MTHAGSTFTYADTFEIPSRSYTVHTYTIDPSLTRDDLYEMIGTELKTPSGETQEILAVELFAHLGLHDRCGFAVRE